MHGSPASARKWLLFPLATPAVNQLSVPPISKLPAGAFGFLLQTMWEKGTLAFGLDKTGDVWEYLKGSDPGGVLVIRESEQTSADA